MTHLHALARNAAAEFLSGVAEVAGFRRPAPVEALLRGPAMTLWQEPLAPSLARLSPAVGKDRNWLDRLRGMVLINLAGGLSATHYHLARIQAMESRLIALATALPPDLGLPPGFGLSGGDTRALSYEYQAFQFDLRRSLEYLAGTLGAFFKTDLHRIRTAVAAISGRTPEPESAAVVALLQQHLSGLQDLVPPDKTKRRSPRDRLAHWEHVEAGTLSITWGPKGVAVQLLAGGEGLSDMFEVLRPGDNPPSLLTGMRLTPILASQLMRVEALCADTFTALGLKA